VVASSADFEFTVTMARPVEVSCADRSGWELSIKKQNPTTIATLQVPAFIIL
jgi:hypothetical protein